MFEWCARLLLLGLLGPMASRRGRKGTRFTWAICFPLNFSRGKGKKRRLTFSSLDKDTGADGRSCSTAGKGAGERCFDLEGQPQTAGASAVQNE